MSTSGVNRWLHESLGSECRQCRRCRHLTNQSFPNLHYQRSANQQSFAGLPTPPDHERCFIVFPFFEAKDLNCGKIFGVTKAIFHLIVPTLEVLLYYLIIIRDNFCIALFSGVPKFTALYNILQHFRSFTNIIHIIMTTNNL